MRTVHIFFAVGDVVEIEGSQGSQAELLNGKWGTVVRFQDTDGKYVICVDSVDESMLRVVSACNLIKPAREVEVGDAVRYKAPNGTWSSGTVKLKDRSMDPPAYITQLKDGTDKNTVLNRLRPNFYSHTRRRE